MRTKTNARIVPRPSHYRRFAAFGAARVERFLLTAAVATSTLVASLSARAALMAYEGFNYSIGSGNLTGLQGGFGWSGPWQTVNNGASSVQAGSLVAGGNAPSGYDALSSGGSAFTPNGTREGRSLDLTAGGAFGAKGYLNSSGNIGASGKTIYISFMQQPNAANNNYYEFEFHRGDLGDPGRIGGVGNDTGGSSSIYLRTPSASQTLIGPGSASVSLYVVRIDFQGGNDTVYVYQNPASATEPGTPTLVLSGAGDMSFTGLSFGAFVNGRTVAHDEIRVGETWADVTSPGAYSVGTWDGGGADGKWSTAANWDNNVLPVFAAALTFTGNTRVNITNDLTGVSANGITFDSAAGAFALRGNDLGLNGDIGFNANPNSLVTQTINLNLTPSRNFLVNTCTNGNITINGNITGAGIELTKAASGNVGVLTLAGTNSLKGMVVNNGTNRITGATSINGVGGSSFFYLADGQTTRTATLIIENGATLSVVGGFQDAGVIGRNGGIGTVIQNGGTFNFNINDGSHNYLFVGASGDPNTLGEYDMNGGLLDMNGTTLGIALGANAVITGLVKQVGGVITNVGQLYFNPFFTQGHGIYSLTGGSIYIGSGGITNFPGSSYEIYLGGGTIGSVASWASTSDMTLTGSNGTVRFSPASGTTIALAGSLSGTGGLTVAGAGVLELSGANTYTGDTTVNAGSTLQLDSSGSSSGALRIASGGVLNLSFSGTYAVGNLYTNGVAVPIGSYDSGSLSGFVTGSGSLQVVSSISKGIWTGIGGNNNWSTPGNWDNNAVPVFPHSLTFAGTARLNNNNDLIGITVAGLTFSNNAGAFVIAGNDITMNGNIGFSSSPFAPVTETMNLGLTWNANVTLNLPTNGNLNLGGNVNASAYNFTKTGAGTLTLGGADNFAGYYLNGGTNIITGNVSISGAGGYVFLGNGDASFNGTLVIQPGATLTVGGTFSDAMVIGRDGGSGTVIQNGGTFSYNNPTHAYLFVGATSHPGTQAEYDMNGGVLDMNGQTLGLALGDSGVIDTGTLNQTGGAINNVFALDVGAVRSFGHGVYNLSGGSITIDFGGIISDSGNYSINLGGGTIQASSSWTSPLNMNLTNLNGSVTFNTAGNVISLSGALSGNGGLTVTGGGTLELSGANSYTGDTVVTVGSTLQLDAAGTGSSAFRVASGGVLNLNYSGTYSVRQLYVDGVAKPIGVYNAGNLPGVISGSGNVQVMGVVFVTQPQDQLIYLNGNYHQSVTLTSAIIGGPATFQWYFNGNVLPGATSSNLTLANLQITNAGNLYVVAAGSSGTATSRVASITIYALKSTAFAYDGFDYPGSVVVDGSSQNGGFGWNGPWQHTDGNGVLITAGSLVGGAGVPSGFDSRGVGNCIEVPSNAQTRSGRYFDCSSTGELAKQGFIDGNGNIGADGKTIYLSFLQQPDRTSGFYELEFHRGSLSDPGRIGGIGNDAGGNNVNLRAPNSVNNRSLGAGSTGVNFYVVRIDFKAGNDDVFVYRNPTSTTEPATPTLTVSNVADMSFTGVSVAAYNGPDVKVDEIRLGATWADAIGMAVSNLLPPTKTANGWKVRFAATPGRSYRVQRAADVTGPWSVIATVTAPENGYLEYEDTSAPTGRSFYRTVTP